MDDQKPKSCCECGCLLTTGNTYASFFVDICIPCANKIKNQEADFS